MWHLSRTFLRDSGPATGVPAAKRVCISEALFEDTNAEAAPVALAAAGAAAAASTGTTPKITPRPVLNDNEFMNTLLQQMADMQKVTLNMVANQTLMERRALAERQPVGIAAGAASSSFERAADHRAVPDGAGEQTRTTGMDVDAGAQR